MIKQPIFLLLSVLLLLVAGFFVVKQIKFLSTAQRTTGQVSNVTSHNDRCGGRRHRYSCTKYKAFVNYSVANNGYQLGISAGKSSGHNQPVSEADYKVGQNVKIAYAPEDPAHAYEDSFMGIWGTPFLIFVFQIISFFASLSEPRRQY